MRDLPRGLTPREVGSLLRISPDRIRSMIQRGELGAIDTSTARCRKPRYVVLPHHLAEWERTRSAARPAPAPRRRRQAETVDYYPD